MFSGALTTCNGLLPRHWGQTCLTLAPQTAPGTISVAAHRWCWAASCRSEGQRQPQAERRMEENVLWPQSKIGKGTENIIPCQLESHNQAPGSTGTCTQWTGGSRSPSRRFNHGITKSSTLFQGEWLQCWCDPLWNVLEWCLGRFPKLGGPQGELREPPETFSSHGRRCWELGLEAKVAKCSDTCKRCHLALVIPSDTNRETICTAAGTEGAGKALKTWQLVQGATEIPHRKSQTC